MLHKSVPSSCWFFLKTSRRSVGGLHEDSWEDRGRWKFPEWSCDLQRGLVVRLSRVTLKAPPLPQAQKDKNEQKVPMVISFLNSQGFMHNKWPLRVKPSTGGLYQGVGMVQGEDEEEETGTVEQCLCHKLMLVTAWIADRVMKVLSSTLQSWCDSLQLPLPLHETQYIVLLHTQDGGGIVRVPERTVGGRLKTLWEWKKFVCSCRWSVFQRNKPSECFSLLIGHSCYIKSS